MRVVLIGAHNLGEYMDKKVLSFPEFREYAHFGRDNAYRLISDDRCNFSFKAGKRWYIIKDLFDKYIQFCSKNNLDIYSGYDKIIT